jgi:cold shock CspA family protein
MNALLKGDYDAFRHDDEHYIFSMYQADDEIRQSPLIHLRILLLLRASHKKGATDEQRYLSIRSIFAYFDLTGMSESAVEKGVLSLMQFGLIEPYDLASRESTQSLKLAITYSGLAHLEMALSSRAYIEQMAISTRIANYEVVNEMDSVFRSQSPLVERMSKIVGIFVHYLDEEDKKYVRIGTGPELSEQRLVGDDLVRQWASSARPQSAEVDSIGTGTEHGLVRKDIAATVEYFDATKGFGFVTSPEMKERVFLHQSVVATSGLQAVHDGDDLRCDVSRGTRGLYISKIHEILKPTKLASEALNAAIIRLFPDRGYGFVRVSAIGADALFHYSLLSEATQEKLELELELRVNVRSGKSGLGYQVKQIVGSEDSISHPVRSSSG